MSNGSKVLIYLSLYLSASISRIVDSNPQGLISSTYLLFTCIAKIIKFSGSLNNFIVKIQAGPNKYHVKITGNNLHGDPFFGKFSSIIDNVFDLEFNYIENQELALLVKPMRKTELGFNVKIQPEKLSAYLDIASYPYNFFKSAGIVINYYENTGSIDFGWQDNEYLLN